MTHTTEDQYLAREKDAMPQTAMPESGLTAGAERNDDPCANCGAPMRGDYCSICGQAKRHFLRFFPAVVGDFIAETFEIDGRLSRTLKAILFSPGKLTNEYLSGRRVHYSPPVRFYLFTSLLAFLLISMEVNKSINLTITDDDDIGISKEAVKPAPDAAADSTESTQSSAETTRDRAVQAAVADGIIDADQAAKIDQALNAVKDQQNPEEDDEDVIVFNGAPWHPTENPIQIDMLPASANRFLNDRAGRLKSNVPRIKEDPTVLVDQFLRYMPQTMLVLLPVFALILKLFYPFSKRYYTEHMIFSIHMHCFTLLAVIIAVLLGELESLSTFSWLNTGLNAGFIAVMVWVPVYGLIAQKRVYRQGWFVSTLKYMAVYSLYFAVQMVTIAFLIILGATSL